MNFQIIGGWSNFTATNDVLPSIDKLIPNFVENIKKLRHMVSEDIDVNHFQNILADLIRLLLNDPKVPIESINSMLEKYKISPKPKPSFKIIFLENKIIREILILVGIILSGGPVTFVAYVFGGNEQTLIIVWVMISTALLIIYFQLKRHGTKDRVLLPRP